MWRFDSVEEAYRDTFEWIFELPNDDQSWDDFQGALQSSSTTEHYFISGEAGSGKSTLIKFIVEHQQTEISASLHTAYPSDHVHGYVDKPSISSYSAASSSAFGIVNHLCSLYYNHLDVQGAYGKSIASHGILLTLLQSQDCDQL